MDMISSPTDRSTLPPYSRISQKVCPRCHQPFDDGGVAAKVYCSVRCRNGMKNVRAVGRDRMMQRAGAAVASVHATPSAEIRLVNPTIEQLDEHEAKLHSGAINTSITVVGLIPEWKPKNFQTVWLPQYDGAKLKDPAEFVMITEKMLDER